MAPQIRIAVPLSGFKLLVDAYKIVYLAPKTMIANRARKTKEMMAHPLLLALIWSLAQSMHYSEI